jgi:hypothetical protein
MTIALSVVAASLLVGYPSVNLGNDTGNLGEKLEPNGRNSTPLDMGKTTAERIITKRRWRLRTEHRCLELKVLRLGYLAEDECAIARRFGPEVLNAITRDRKRRTDPAYPSLAVAGTPASGG